MKNPPLHPDHCNHGANNYIGSYEQNDYHLYTSDGGKEVKMCKRFGDSSEDYVGLFVDGAEAQQVLINLSQTNGD